MVATAEWIADRLRRVGATEVEVISTDLHPIVYGRIHEAPGAPTVIVYCHYDVQPVDPLDLWEHPPFEPFVRDGRFIGRGVADDKGQLVMHLGALEALRAVGRAPAVNLTFVFEGEEEYGSQSLEAWIAEQRRPALAADAVVISDTGFFEGNVPAITVGLRGHHVRADRRGAVAGRPALGRRTAAPSRTRPTRWPSIIASLKGSGRPRPHPRVLRRRGRADRRPSARRWPRCRSTTRRSAPSIPVPALVGEAGWTTLERKSARPTLDVNGMWSGFQGEGAQDDHPGPRAREGLDAPRRQPGAGQDLRGAPGPCRRRRPGRRHGHDAVAPRRASRA